MSIALPAAPPASALPAAAPAAAALLAAAAVIAATILPPGAAAQSPEPGTARPGASVLILPAALRGTVFERNAALGRGINLGSALDAPVEGDWGLTLEAGHFDAVAAAGFDSVRVPVRFAAHAAAEPPHAIAGPLLERVDWVLDQAERAGLAAVLTLHGYDEIMASPAAERARFLAIWGQLGARHAARPDSLAFELLNEPRGAFDADPGSWNALAAEALAAVRAQNPTRPVLIGPVGQNAVERLGDLALPDDADVIATIHYYAPFGFTHQGASWIEPVPPVGARWAPDAASLGDAFEDWSWDTRVEPLDGRLGVRFAGEYAALGLHRATDSAPARIALGLSGRAGLNVLCRAGGAEFATVGTIEAAGPGRTDVEVDLSACGPGTTDVALQNLLADPPTLELEDGALCDAAGCEPVVTTAGAAVDRDLARAARWADAAGVPLNVGEFGVHRQADAASRAAWTGRVARAARTVGASRAYWELVGDFGIWDPDARKWDEPSLRALGDAP